MNDLLEIIDSILEDANESIVANLNAKVKESTLKVFGGCITTDDYNKEIANHLRDVFAEIAKS